MSTDDHSLRIADHARARRPLPALRQGQAVRRLPDAAAALRGCGLDYSFADSADGPAFFVMFFCGLHRRRSRAWRWRSLYQPPYLGARACCGLPLILLTTLGAAAADEGPADRAAVSSQGRRRPPRRRRRAVSARVATPGARAGLALPGCSRWWRFVDLHRARHLAARAQGLEGRADRHARAAPGARARPSCRRASAGRASIRPMTSSAGSTFSAAFAARAGGAGLRQRLGVAQRRVGARLLGVRAGAACGRRRRRGQPRLRAGGAARSEEPLRRRRRRARRDHRRAALAGAARLVHAEGRSARNLWFVRDQLAMAAAKGWGEVAPFYVELESPQPPGGLPRAGRAQGRAAQRSPAIRAHLVRARGGPGGHVRILAARALSRRRPPRLPCESPPF